MRTKPVVGALLAGACASLLGAGPAMSMTIAHLPPENMQGDVKYVTGGIGTDEARAMRKAESRYPLSLEFAQRAKPRDEFLANVKVTIADHAGKTALETTSSGPFLLAKLPDGKYSVRAEDGGKAKVREVTVAAHRHEHLLFEW